MPYPFNRLNSLLLVLSALVKGNDLLSHLSALRSCSCRTALWLTLPARTTAARITAQMSPIAPSPLDGSALCDLANAELCHGQKRFGFLPQSKARFPPVNRPLSAIPPARK